MTISSRAHVVTRVPWRAVFNSIYRNNQGKFYLVKTSTHDVDFSRVDYLNVDIICVHFFLILFV